MSSCPLTIKKLKVRSLSVDFNEVSWEVEATTIDVLDYTFQVLRSEGPEGPWDELSPQFEDQYLYLDDAVMKQHRYRQWYYKIRVRRKSSQQYWDSPAAELGQEEDLIAGELRTHINILMREFIGERCWVLPVRTFGTRCSCYSTTLRNKTRSGCRLCWDTSFIRGYMHPIESWISFDPSPANEQFTSVGKLQQNETTARMGYFPPLKPGDLIVSSATVQRWSVTQVSETRHVGTPVHQEVQLHEVPQTAIEYDIPLKLCDELRNLFLKPERQFTNPTQLDALDDEAYNGIFSIYNTHNCGDPPCR
jgi:hypothetical protein